MRYSRIIAAAFFAKEALSAPAPVDVVRRREKNIPLATASSPQGQLSLDADLKIRERHTTNPIQERSPILSINKFAIATGEHQDSDPASYLKRPLGLPDDGHGLKGSDWSTLR